VVNAQAIHGLEIHQCVYTGARIERAGGRQEDGT